ncbi:MAG: T9SS type A sorting domain-containing protein [Bacteroidetes bacterium]|nr:T9SS type A sorting domain-containing protein [Bacteroidota bacterium]
MAKMIVKSTLIIFVLLGLTIFSKAQTFLWANVIGSTGADVSYGIAIDDTGNVYLTGYFAGTTDFDPGAGTANLTSVGDADIFFAKYDMNGNYVWAHSIGTGWRDEGLDITVDDLGNVYITGYFRDPADFDPGAGISILTPVASQDIYFAKYDAAGNYLWARAIGSKLIDLGADISVDASGNVYLTGSIQDTTDFDPGAGTAILTTSGAFFAKYDSGGNYLWANVLDGCAGSRIDIDNSANVYVTGYFFGTVDFDPGAGTTNLTSVGLYDIFFAKYDSAGNLLWARNMGGPSLDVGASIVVDDSGKIYLTGFFVGTADFDPGAGTANLTAIGFSDIFFAKYDETGKYIWAKKIGGGNIDLGSSIALDGSGHVYVTGQFQGTADFDPGAGVANLSSAGVEEIFFAKYDSGGNYIWANRIGSSGIDASYIITIDVSGNLYITGSFSGTADFNPGTGTNNLTSGGDLDIFYAKYTQGIVGVEELLEGDKWIGLNFLVYPNPTANQLIIKPISDKFKIEKIQLFDLLGKEQRIELTGNKIDLTSISDGFYFLGVTLESGQVIMKKVIKNSAQ